MTFRVVKYDRQLLFRSALCPTVQREAIKGDCVNGANNNRLRLKEVHRGRVFRGAFTNSRSVRQVNNLIDKSARRIPEQMGNRRIGRSFYLSVVIFGRYLCQVFILLAASVLID